MSNAKFEHNDSRLEDGIMGRPVGNSNDAHSILDYWAELDLFGVRYRQRVVARNAALRAELARRKEEIANQS